MTLDRHTTTVYVLDSNGNVVDFTSSGGTSMVDDAAFTTAASSFVPTGGIVTADSVDSGDGGAFAMLANRQQKVTLYDSSGNELSVGGGTQYTQGDTDASITGTAMLMEGAADTLLPVQGTVADGLLVNLGSNNDVTVTGSVTANAGTNLNTSALLTTAAHDAAFGTAGSADAQVRSIQGIASMTPVQVSQATAGNLNVTEASAAAALTALQIMDDWDESDRAKVNSIVGQAGVAAGEGAVGATVQRFTEAGHTPFYNLDVDETEDSIKATAGTLRGFVAINRTADVRYLKFYNATVANVTVGSTTPVLTIPIPANADSDGAGFVWNFPVIFSTAITIAATTGFADNDSGAPGSNDILVAGAYD
jgi:hypothetical protein